MILCIIALCTLPAGPQGESPKTLSTPEIRAAEPDAFDLVIDAILTVESGGDCGAVGDGGLAIGPYQIHRVYWIDATRLLGVAWPYADARDPARARRAVRAYCEHYAAYYGRPWTPETIARIHNGGPTGWRKSATDGYWARVRREMDRARAHAVRSENRTQSEPSPATESPLSVAGVDEDGFDRARSLRLRNAGQG